MNEKSRYLVRIDLIIFFISFIIVNLPIFSNDALCAPALTREKAAALLNSSMARAEVKAEIPLHGEGYSKGVLHGMWQTHENSTYLTDKGAQHFKSISAYWDRSGTASGSVTIDKPINVRIRITGIRSGRVAEFTWEYVGLPSVVKRYVIKGGTGEARFDLYDDGYRLGDVRHGYSTESAVLTAKERIDDEKETKAALEQERLIWQSKVNKGIQIENIIKKSMTQTAEITKLKFYSDNLYWGAKNPTNIDLTITDVGINYAYYLKSEGKWELPRGEMFINISGFGISKEPESYLFNGREKKVYALMACLRVKNIDRDVCGERRSGTTIAIDDNEQTILNAYDILTKAHAEWAEKNKEAIEIMQNNPDIMFINNLPYNIKMRMRTEDVVPWENFQQSERMIFEDKLKDFLPAKVEGLSGVTTVAHGMDFTVAIKKNGTIWTYGDNKFGQLGDGSNINRLTPVQVKGLPGVRAVGVLYFTTFALASDATVWAWGGNAGVFGDGTNMNRVLPVQVKGLSGIEAIASGENNVIALRNDGTVWIWGNNNSGQLGDGTIKFSYIPVQVKGLSGVTKIAVRNTTAYALKDDGTVWAWGNNEFGQLGVGDTINSPTPVQVKGLNEIVSFAVGADNIIVVRNDGTVWSWGNNDVGQLGVGNTINSSIPVQVKGLSGISFVSASGGHAVALKNDGTVWTWGLNSSGELGDGTTADRSTPVQVKGLSGCTSLVTGYGSTVTIKKDGTVWAFGKIANLGNGIIINSPVPVQVRGLSDISSIIIGHDMRFNVIVAIKKDGTVWEWRN